MISCRSPFLGHHNRIGPQPTSTLPEADSVPLSSPSSSSRYIVQKTCISSKGCNCKGLSAPKDTLQKVQEYQEQQKPYNRHIGPYATTSEERKRQRKIASCCSWIKTRDAESWFKIVKANRCAQRDCITCQRWKAVRDLKEFYYLQAVPPFTSASQPLGPRALLSWFLRLA